MLFSRDSCQSKRHTQTESKWMEKDISCNGTSEKSGLAMHLSDKIDFKAMAIIKDKNNIT